MLRGVSEPFHNAPKIFRPFSKAFNSHLSNLSNRRPPPNITFPLLKERNGIDRRKSSFISRLLLFFRSKKPTNNHGSPTGTTKKISRKERERRRKGGGKELARNLRKQKHSGTTSFTSFFSRFLSTRKRNIQEHLSGCATFDRESGLVILQSPASPRYVIARAPSKQPRSQGSIKCVHSHDLHSEYGIAGTARGCDSCAWLSTAFTCGQTQNDRTSSKIHRCLLFVIRSIEEGLQYL